jgi:hypothetical protein
MMDSGRTAMLAPMLRQLAEAARVHRRQLVIDATERQFYLGVEAAAQGLLHPEVDAGRTRTGSNERSQNSARATSPCSPT